MVDLMFIRRGKSQDKLRVNNVQDVRNSTTNGRYCRLNLMELRTGVQFRRFALNYQ